MNTRRDFMKLATGGLLATTALKAADRAEKPVEQLGQPEPLPPAYPERVRWCMMAARLADPVLGALSRRRLKVEMPCEAAVPADRRPYTHLEALGRLLCGLAPWLELPGDDSEEGRERTRLAGLARVGIDAGTDPKSPDLMNFSEGKQPLVDAAFLAQAMLRAPNELWKKLEPRVQANVIAALKSSRLIEPGENNWKLFASEIEVFLHRAGEKRDEARLNDALQSFQKWYVGDSYYGDGPEFHWDYYNSFVIHPMLLETLDVVAAEKPEWTRFHALAGERLTRYAQIQERLITPTGMYPAIGRSLAYRCGAFQGLALAALRHLLPEDVGPGRARAALTGVILRTLDQTPAWDEKGWLRIGLSGHQKSLGEPYISTGSLYLCSAAFLPLGLPATDPFWASRATPGTWEKVWGGQDLPADHALKPSV
jgi:hypothetical protein